MKTSCEFGSELAGSSTLRAYASSVNGNSSDFVAPERAPSGDIPGY